MNELIITENPQLRSLLSGSLTNHDVVKLVKPGIEGIYSIQQLESKKFYVGYSSCIRSRLLSHLEGRSWLTSDKTWIFHIVEYTIGYSKSRIINREAYWCLSLNSFTDGYNRSRDGSGFDSNRGRIWVHDHQNNYRIFEEQLPSYPEFELGFLGCTIKGKLNITKEGIDKRISGDDLGTYLDEGWEEGKEFAPNSLSPGYEGYHPKSHKTRMNNGVDEVYITDTWYHHWKNKGYVAGKLKERFTIVTNGLEEVSIYDHEVPEYLSKGYVKQYLVEYHNASPCITPIEGYIPPVTGKRMWLNKMGQETSIIDEGDTLQRYLDDGWTRGRSIIQAPTANGRYSPDRWKVTMIKGDDQISISHVWIPYWENEGYIIGRLDNKKYISDGETESIIYDVSPVPEGFEEKSIADFHRLTIDEVYRKEILNQ